ncbi:MAG: hypothetical protein Q8L49_14480 [Burkholderiaceae bacterium]|nr:hypothetical protein [Burkholderiaceae bacterium]
MKDAEFGVHLRRVWRLGRWPWLSRRQWLGLTATGAVGVFADGVRRSLNNPLPCGDAVNARLVDIEVVQAGDEMVFDGLQGIEDAVMEVLLAQLVPQMFDRVEFGRIRRQEHLHARRIDLGQHQGVGHPSCGLTAPKA